ANPVVESSSPSVRLGEDSVSLVRDGRVSKELSLSNTANVDQNVAAELEDRSDQEEVDVTVNSNVELTSSIPRSDEDEVEDQAGHSNVLDDIEASTSGRTRDIAMRLMKKERRSFPEIRRDVPHSNDLISKEDPVDLLKFGALTWEAKRKLIPYLNHLFVTPREKNQVDGGASVADAHVVANV
ncbi:hypothetical protein FRX31_004041, partial [Thalictrum thalictroides]